MTYLVLARKWRPRSFDTLVGQDHVVRALSHALSTQRLHHAWLFTGTRGVGKTTLSRILAKSLNCETGITDKPCGTCQACTEIDAGRFVDYIELDAASNRGVDEMTQLLEQAIYAPSSGRFKVYMIDEVHMLSGHAFNAMLKTLEEPPAHVKFILATTDPQKIPPTVLSRCLQFNLKQMPPAAVAEHLTQVLTAEGVAFEPAALTLIGQAAQGSMRDALSLTDQAIAFSAGNMTESAVRSMLGNVDQSHLVRLIDALAAQQAQAVLAIADEFVDRGISMRTALSDLAILISRIAIAQRLPLGTDPADAVQDTHRDIKRLAQTVSPDVLQVLYTVAVHSRQELALAPDEYAGFVMACLRMLSLCEGNGVPATSASSAPPTPAPLTSTPAVTSTPSAASVSPEPSLSKLTQTDQWPQFIQTLELSGMALQLARQSECVSVTPGRVMLRVMNQTLAQGPHAQRVVEALNAHLGQDVQIEITVGELMTGLSAHQLDEQAQQQRQLEAEQAVAQDSFVQTLIREFDGQIVPGSIQAVTPPTRH